jgi:hypothetical protein
MLMTMGSFTASHHNACFRWASEWAEIRDFQLEPVVTDKEAGPILQEMV